MSSNFFDFRFCSLRNSDPERNCDVFLSIGIAFNLVLYAFVNAAVVTGIFPVTGLQMPMVSYGGSGMVINMAMMGILLNISQSRRSVVGSRSWNPAFYV